MFRKLARLVCVAMVAALALAGLAAAPADPPATGSAAKGLTAVAGLTVGHHTLTERPTGCTVILTGAEGLDAASGVMRFLDERKIGFKIAGTQVPIVPSAILMDLAFGGKPEVRPGPD